MTPLWKRIVTYTPLTLLIIVVLGAVLGDGGGSEIPAAATPATTEVVEGPTTTSTSGTSPTNTSSPTSSSNPPTSLPEGSESASVVSVIDGDTIRVDFAGGSNESVRLIGINTPESDECYGPEASAALSVLVDQQNVVMARDVSNRDQFGRLLRYIYLPDGTFVNLVMVRQGYALAREFPPDTCVMRDRRPSVSAVQGQLGQVSRVDRRNRMSEVTNQGPRRILKPDPNQTRETDGLDRT